MRTCSSLIGLLVASALISSCALKRSNRIDILDLSYGTKTYGKVAATNHDFMVVRFTKIEAIGYSSLENPERKINILRLFHCDPCNYEVGESVEAGVYGGDRKSDPLGYEINFLNTANENDVSFRRLRHGHPR